MFSLFPSVSLLLVTSVEISDGFKMVSPAFTQLSMVSNDFLLFTELSMFSLIAAGTWLRIT